MKILVSRIAKELEKAAHCAVYEPDLSRVWPDDGRQRELQVSSFAKMHGWRLRYYKDGFCAIFDEDPFSLKSHQGQSGTHGNLASVEGKNGDELKGHRRLAKRLVSNMTTRKHVVYSFLALVSLFGVGITQSAKANLVTNGGFETGHISGWAVGSGSPHSVGGGRRAKGIPVHSGNFAAFLRDGMYSSRSASSRLRDGFSVSSINQFLTTTPGTSYIVNFWLANDNQNGTPNNSFAVRWGGTNLTSLTDVSNFGYTKYTFNVTASTATTALQFRFSHDFNAGGFLLDDVSVHPAGVGVPDAGSTLPPLGFASLGLVALRRKLRC